MLSQYHSETGDSLVPLSHETEGNVKIGRWVHNQRMTHSKGKLRKNCVKRLEELGFVWS